MTSTGLYTLYPGTVVATGGFGGSGEFAPTGVGAREITAGMLVVTDALPAAVPEASTTVSFGLLLMLGLGGLAAAKKRKSAAQA